ncbi:hypothetical protein ACH5AO_34645 [Streptomyces sp. NPDC018964]|uniref:hypothetical protein n=1 Tax=Streptomyces sp. NPDC018964 TaxID=3365058 RepID=UPI00378EF33A
MLSVACPFTPARVERGLAWDCVSVRWSWWAIDTGSDFLHWNGIVALGVNSGGPASPEVEVELFRTDPPPEQLKAGDICRVGVPPTVVHMTAVDHHEPSLETGRLPRPHLTVRVLRRGLSCREFPDGSHLDGTGYTLRPGGGIPFVFDLLMRPYASLCPSDEVADAAGRHGGPTAPGTGPPSTESRPARAPSGRSSCSPAQERRAPSRPPPAASLPWLGVMGGPTGQVRVRRPSGIRSFRREAFAPASGYRFRSRRRLTTAHDYRAETSIRFVIRDQITGTVGRPTTT